MNHKCPFMLLLQLLISVTGSSLLQSLKFIKFEPSYIHDLFVDTNTSVQLTVQLDSYNRTSSKFQSHQKFEIVLRSMDEEIASIAENCRRQVMIKEFEETDSGSLLYKMNATINGKFLGKTTVRAFLKSGDQDDGDLSFHEIAKDHSTEHRGNLDVWVIHDPKRLVNRIFMVTLIFLVIVANILMGCELDVHVVLQTIKKPVAPIIGFCTQFIAMPLLAYGIANVVFMPKGMYSFALGLFVAGCAPGGGASNYWTYLLDGNLPVSVTMTFVSTLAALVMLPMWMWLLGFHFLYNFHSEAQIKIPYGKIVSSLILMVTPLIAGVLLARCFPSTRQNARKCIRPFMIFVLIFLLGFGTLANLYMIKLLSWEAVIGGLLLPWCGFAIGCLTSIALRQSPPTVTAIAVETGIQNSGIAIMLLKFSFPDPDADISSLMPVITACMTPIPILAMVCVHRIMKYMKHKKSVKRASAIITVNTGTNVKLNAMEMGKTQEDQQLVNEKVVL